MPNSYSALKNPFATLARGPSEPGIDAVRIIPSDTVDLDPYCKTLRIFVPSNIDEATVRVTPILAADDANTVTLKYAPGVTYEPLAVRRVWVTGTSTTIEIHGYTR